MLANKQDLSGAMTSDEIRGYLKLDEIQTHRWHIERCSAKTGEQLLDGLNWLVAEIANRIYLLD